MELKNKKLFDKVFGCLIGGLIGDAMGAPVENKHYKDIEAEYGTICDFEGEGTDDSAIKLILCDSIIKNNGYVTADEFAGSFLEFGSKYYDLYFIPVRNMFHKIQDKLSLPVYAGVGNMQSSSSAMSISPMGLINACNPRQAAIETFDVAGLIHAGDTTFCRDAACAMAAAVAEAMKTDSTVESIINAATCYLHKESSRVMLEYISKVMEMATTLNDYESFRKSFYENCLQNVICDSRETVPCALALFHLAKGDPDKAIIYGANFGRDSDTIATMVGALAGAYKGADAINQAWVNKMSTNAPKQTELANQIINIIEKRMENTKKTIEAYEKLYTE